MNLRQYIAELHFSDIKRFIDSSESKTPKSPIITVIPSKFLDALLVPNNETSVPRHNVLVVMGDFNARVGSTDGRFAFHKETNRNGEKLVELTQEFGLEICNTKSQNQSYGVIYHQTETSTSSIIF